MDIPQSDGCDDHVRVLQRMDDRRALVGLQEKAAEYREYIYGQFYQQRTADVSEEIRRLRDSGHPLYDYILRLENVNIGIWCDRCCAPKTMHPAGEYPSLAGESTQGTTTSPIPPGVLEDIARVSAQLDGLRATIVSAENEYLRLSEKLDAIRDIVSGHTTGYTTERTTCHTDPRPRRPVAAENAATPGREVDTLGSSESLLASLRSLRQESQDATVVSDHESEDFEISLSDLL